MLIVILNLLMVFNPRAFIARNQIELVNKTWTDTFLFRQPKIKVLTRSPIWKLQIKRAALLGEESNASTTGRQELVDGVASVIEVDAGYVIKTGEEEFWTSKISGGYVCGRSFYATPHPNEYVVVDLIGCIIVLVVGAVVSITVIVPNFMHYLIYKEVSSEKTQKYKKLAYGLLIFGSIMLVYISLIATDLFLEVLGSPHLTKVSKNKCYVINNYTDKWTNNGSPGTAKAIYKEFKDIQRNALQKKMMRKMIKGKVENNSRNWRLYEAGLLADTEKVFIQQASMTDLGNGTFRFKVPCGAAITSVSTKAGVPQVSYKWIPNIAYTSQNISMTFIDEAKSDFQIWCSGAGDKATKLDQFLKNGGYDYGFESGRFGWSVWCTTCSWSYQYGNCLFGYKYSPAGNFVLRNVISVENGGYLSRGETDAKTGIINWKKISESDSTISNFVMNNSYADRKGGWFENMSHTIMQEGWKGWDIEHRADEFINWRSSMIPSQNEGDIQRTLKGRAIIKKAKRNTFCDFDIDRTATARVTTDHCFSEFDMKVDKNSQWIETAAHCKAVYASKVGDKISVSVDNVTNEDEYCGITLTIGDIEKVYYIRPSEPWVGYKLDAWRCRSYDDGIRGKDCDPGRNPETVNYEKFNGLFDTVVTTEVHNHPDDSLFQAIKDKIILAFTILISSVTAIILVFITVKFSMKLCTQATVEGAKRKVTKAIANRKIKKENHKTEEI